ncbi:MAG: TssA family type VI secretion system protein [Deltaproteobacteria bacterium]|nr:TssA family type VI secretion system protein [Deltaproteobacteria bacterium]
MTIPPSIASIGSQPFPGDAPAGRDVRLEPSFLSLQSEIDRLNSMSGTPGAVNWPKAVEISLAILESDSKDLLVAAYLAVSLMETEGFAALAPGATLLSDLLGTFWPNLFPPLKRLRARVNAMDWWKEKSLAYLKKYQGPPISPRALGELQDAYAKLEKTLSAQDPPLTFLGDLTRALGALPLETGAGAAPEAAGQASPQASPQAAPQASPQAAPQAPPKPAPKAPEAAPTAPAAPAPAPGAAPLAGEEAAYANLSAGLDSYLSVFGEDWESPLRWKTSRLKLWLKIKKAPPAQEDGRSALPAPPLERIASLNSLLEAGKRLEALKEAEDLIPSFVFALDPQKISYDALRELGYLKAAQALKDELLLLVERFPELLTRAFEDGSPFASPATAAFLKESAAGASSCGETGPVSSLGEDLAPPPFLDGDPKEALRRFSLPENRPLVGRRALMEKIWKISLWRKLKRADMAESATEEVMAEIEARGLAFYDPPVARAGILAALAVYRAHVPPLPGKIRELLFKLSQIDPLEVLNER